MGPLRRTWPWWAVASLLAALTRAQEIPRRFVELDYDIDPTLQDCPDAAEFRSLIASKLGYDPYRPDSDLGIVVRVQSTDTALEGTIEWTTAQKERVGERHFSSPSRDCHDMMTTMGFVVAVQIQFMATEPAASSAPQASSTRPAASTVSRQPPPVLGSRKAAPGNGSAVAPAQGRDAAIWSVSGGIGPLVGLGLGPDPIALGRLFFAVQRGRIGLELGGEASLPDNTRQVEAGGFRHQLMLGTLAGCGVFDSVSACGLAKLGSIHVDGVGVDVPNSSSGFVALVGPRAAYSLGLGGSFLLGAHVDVLYLLTPWTVDLNHMTVWTMPRLGGEAGIDIGLRFP